jgi:hypothetical protein
MEKDVSSWEINNQSTMVKIALEPWKGDQLMKSIEID